MRIIQFTDVHVGMSDQDTRGINTRENFTKILDVIKEAQPDKLVLTGDVCFKEPREEVCYWVKEELEARGLTPFVITGNHDTSAMIAKCFDMPLVGSEVYYEQQWGDTKCLFLDTGLAVMSEEQWSWFESKIDFDGRLIIFAHHPPMYAAVPYMDVNHAFKQNDRFKSLISRRNRDVHLFCGHYHVSKSISNGNLHVHITPSTFFQIRDDMEDFGVASYDIAYREIQLDNGVLRHSVKWLDLR